jgi:predicted short-subunit dehydrogenase-like oxidoreductase (DUF2520 family)
MTTKMATGLVAAGGASRSFLARMPAVLAGLGPVKAASFRVARRIVNALHRGYAVFDYAALELCDLIWIYVPDQMLDRVSSELAARMAIDGTMVVFCESVRDSRWPKPLRRAGARIASLNVVDESRERTFVAEGHPETLRALRRFVATEKRKMIEIEASSKALYFAGVHLAAHLLLPWIAAAVQSLRAAGFSRAEAIQLAHSLGARALRTYGKAGPKAWTHAAASHLLGTVEHDLETVRAADSRLASLYADGVTRALDYFERDSRPEVHRPR